MLETLQPSFSRGYSNTERRKHSARSLPDLVTTCAMSASRIVFEYALSGKDEFSAVPRKRETNKRARWIDPDPETRTDNFHLTLSVDIVATEIARAINCNLGDKRSVSS